MARTLFGRSLIAGAVLAMTAGAVQAQNVTLYGRVDLGIQHNTEANDDGDSLTELYNGGIRPSIWGMKGSEDLGGGLSAFFNLEAHFNADTGVGVEMFRRQANVGLKGDWGAMTLGTQYSPAVLALLATDPRAIKEQLSGLYGFALNQNGVSPSNDLGIFLNNSISYTGTFGPVNVGVAYAFGEQADEMEDGSIWSLGGTYTGPITVSGYYQQIDGVDVVGGDTGEAEQMGLGVAVPFGGMTIKGQYIKAEVEGGAGVGTLSDTDIFALGLDFAWNQSNTLTVAYYLADNDEIDDDKTQTFIISNDYALSKRTTLYAQVALIDYDDGATGFTSMSTAPVVPGEKATLFGVGVSHNF